MAFVSHQERHPEDNILLELVDDKRLLDRLIMDSASQLNWAVERNTRLVSQCVVFPLVWL